MTLTETISAIRPLCEKSMRAAETRFQSLAIPLGSLRLREHAGAQLAGARSFRWPGRGAPPCPESVGARPWYSAQTTALSRRA